MGRGEDKPPLALSRPYIEGIHPAYRWVQETATVLTDFPIAIRPWTVNEESAIRTCLALGLTGIITDFPEKARAIVQQVREETKG